MASAAALPMDENMHSGRDEAVSVGIVEFLRGVCLRMVVHELTQAQYRHELDDLCGPVGSGEQNRAARQSEEFLRRTGEAARESLEAAFKLAEEHLVAREMLACVGELATRLGETISENLRAASADLRAIMSRDPEAVSKNDLREVTARLKRAEEALCHVVSAGAPATETAHRASLRQIIAEALSLCCGPDLTARLATEVDPCILIACRPGALKTAFITILQQVREAGSLMLKCEKLPHQVAVEFRLKGETVPPAAPLFTAELARQIVTEHGGKLTVRSDAQAGCLVYRVLLPGGESSL